MTVAWIKTDYASDTPSIPVHMWLLQKITSLSMDNKFRLLLNTRPVNPLASSPNKEDANNNLKGVKENVHYTLGGSTSGGSNSFSVSSVASTSDSDSSENDSNNEEDKTCIDWDEVVLIDYQKEIMGEKKKKKEHLKKATKLIELSVINKK